MSTDFFRNELYRTRHELYKSFSQINKLISAEGRVRKELRATKHALWMARTERAAVEKFHWHYRYDDDNDKGYTKKYRWLMVEKWCWVERKCLQKAKEFE